MKRSLISIVAIILVIGLVACAQPAPTPAPAPAPAAKPKPALAPKPAPAPTKPTPTKSETIILTMGGGPATWAGHAWYIGLARSMNKFAEVPVKVTVVESSSWMNCHKLVEGTYDLIQAGFSQVWAAYNATKGTPFEGKPKYLEARFFAFREVSYHLYFVTQKSGIKSLSDLKGKKFSVGPPGTMAQVETSGVFEALELGVEEYPGSWADAVAGIQDDRLVGTTFPTAPDVFPGTLQVAHITRPMIFIGLTEEEVKKVREMYPFLIFWHYPKGTMKDLPEVGDFYTFVLPAGLSASTRLPEDVGYALIKAIYENRDPVTAAYPPSAKFDPISTFNNVPEEVAVPLHAGVVRYAREKGIELNDYLIPPEAR